MVIFFCFLKHIFSHKSRFSSQLLYQYLKVFYPFCPFSIIINKVETQHIEIETDSLLSLLFCLVTFFALFDYISCLTHIFFLQRNLMHLQITNISIFLQ